MEDKKCRKCDQVKPISEFKKNGFKSNGTQYYVPECKECRKPIVSEQAKQYRIKHREEIEAKMGEKIPCECGLMIRRDWLSRHENALSHIERMYEQQQEKAIEQQLENLVL
mmetsp:Transcript_58753/g.155440  ORF Transcript_58753/g.155440 Transcript_58753/m.155440 type:complete len:111 (-) Transcript_58753:246-578(-)